ncbi:MAG: carboxypeptidase, partial [Leptospiraceae bacterium]|nr:carboxypeptidase [Leptospiraceae bacterium]
LLGYTTPNWNPSAAMDEFRSQSVNYRTNTQVQSAFISIHPSTGYITAMVGGADFSPRNQFNRALLARRQPGSSFKIYVYGAALEQRKINTSTGLNDLPFALISRTGRVWDPSNYSEGFSGVVPAKTALALSLNTCAVQTFFRVGAEPVIDLASRLMKIRDRSRFNPDPAMALGASEVTPMEMAEALAIIANKGKDVIPFAVRYVTDGDGNILYNKEAAIRKIIAIKTQTGQIQVIEPALAYVMRDMMEEVANGGTAQAGLRTPMHDGGSFQGDFAAKTGTTQMWSDAWIVGFNEDFAQAIWFGYDQGKFSMGGQWAGGSLAAPTLGRILTSYYKTTGRTPPKFDRQKPDGIVGAECSGLGLA